MTFSTRRALPLCCGAGRLCAELVCRRRDRRGLGCRRRLLPAAPVQDTHLKVKTRVGDDTTLTIKQHVPGGKWALVPTPGEPPYCLCSQVPGMEAAQPQCTAPGRPGACSRRARASKS